MGFGVGPSLGGGFLLASDGSDAGAAMGASVVSQSSQGNCTCSPNPDPNPTPRNAPAGGPVPPPQPASGTNAIELMAFVGGGAVPGILVNCIETNVSILSQCYTVFLYVGPDEDILPGGFYTVTGGGGGTICGTDEPVTGVSGTLTRQYNNNPWSLFMSRSG